MRPPHPCRAAASWLGRIAGHFFSDRRVSLPFASQTDTEAVLELQVPFYTETEDVSVTVTEREVQV